MSERVVVLGAGYAGVTAIQGLERELPDADLTLVSREPYHLVLHEVHRVVRDPGVAEKITIPVESLIEEETAFVEGEVAALDTDDRTVELADGRGVEYDYVLVALGSSTAYYGIPGMAEHAHTLKSLADARGIHEAVADAAAAATPEDPAQVVVGGAGLSGIQVAGEVAAYRDEERVPVEVTLVEALEEVLPGSDAGLQAALRRELDDADVEVLTDDPVVEATDDGVVLDEHGSLDADVLVWTGGITGQNCLESAGLAGNHNRVETDATFRTSDDRVFAIGDSALVEQDDDVAPPTAQAAWDAGELAAANVRRTIEGEPLRTWTYRDKGTLISVGEAAIAHELIGIPVRTFDSVPATLMKKLVGARWIGSVASWRMALDAWDAL